MLKFLVWNQLPFCYDHLITGLSSLCETNDKEVVEDYVKVPTMHLPEDKQPGGQS
jgi:hypothetical protein